jgi:Domain of unknown function (DUF5664)
MSERDPLGVAASTPGAKLDHGKVDVLRGAIQYFPKALRAVAHVSELGAKKYSWKGWESVPNGIVRYGAALARHLCFDSDATDSGPGGLGPDVLHAAEAAWNALARLELILREKETNQTAVQVAAIKGTPIISDHASNEAKGFMYTLHKNAILGTVSIRS